MDWLYCWNNGSTVADVPRLNWQIAGAYLAMSAYVKKHHEGIVCFGKGMMATLFVILKLFINIKKII